MDIINLEPILIEKIGTIQTNLASSKVHKSKFCMRDTPFFVKMTPNS